jgi:hypothetical protein
MTTTAVPIIDIDPFLKGSETGRRTDAERVGRACEEIGFLIVVGTGCRPHWSRACAQGRFPDRRERVDDGRAVGRGPSARARRPAQAGAVEAADHVLAVITRDAAAFIQQPLLLPA